MQKQMGAFCVFVLTGSSETSLKPMKIDWDILFSPANAPGFAGAGFKQTGEDNLMLIWELKRHVKAFNI